MKVLLSLTLIVFGLEAYCQQINFTATLNNGQTLSVTEKPSSGTGRENNIKIVNRLNGGNFNVAIGYKNTISNSPVLANGCTAFINKAQHDLIRASISQSLKQQIVKDIKNGRLARAKMTISVTRSTIKKLVDSCSTSDKEAVPNVCYIANHIYQSKNRNRGSINGCSWEMKTQMPANADDTYQLTLSFSGKIVDQKSDIQAWLATAVNKGKEAVVSYWASFGKKQPNAPDRPDFVNLKTDVASLTFDPGADHPINPKLSEYFKELMKRAAEKGITSIRVSSTTNHPTNADRSCHSINNGARAFDVNWINGVHVSGDNPYAKVLQDIVSTTTYAENFGPFKTDRVVDNKILNVPQQQEDHKGHIHICIPLN